MSFETASDLFKRNCELIDPTDDPIVWNLNNGLYHLTVTLERDLAQIKRELQRVSTALNIR